MSRKSKNQTPTTISPSIPVEESQLNLQSLVENTDGSIWSVDTQYRLLVGNLLFHQNVSAAIGRKLAQGENVLSLDLPQAALDEWRAYYDRALAGEKFSIETRTRFVLEERCVEYRLNPIKTVEGQIMGVTIFGRDITERKQAEQERLAHLRFFESMDQVNRAIQGANDLEQMMRDVLEAMLAIFECDRAWLLYPCDPEAATWQVPMECTRPEYPGAHRLGVEMPIDPDMVTTFQTLRASIGPVKFDPESEYPLPSAVAHRFGFQSVIAMALNPKVDKTWALGLHQCSFPRVWTSEEERLFQEIGRRLTDGLSSLLVYRDLRESEDRLRLALMAANQGLYDLNVQTGEARVSPEYATMLGYDPAEFHETNARWIERLHPDDREPVAATYRAYIRGEIPLYAVEFRQRTRRGDWKWILSLGKIVAWDANGSPLRMLGTHTDITKRKQAEEEIRQLNEELEQRVARRTAQLEAANKELEAFSYSVSHDLRAPLRAIDGYTRILEEEYQPFLDTEGQRLCGVVRDETQRMGQLIDDLLAFSRLTRVPLQAIPVKMESLVNSALYELTRNDEPRRLDCQINSLPPAVGDPTLLRQVWLNLLSNALKFSSKRTPAVIAIGGRTEGLENLYYVRDNGAGFNMRYADKLFGVFQRLHSQKEFTGTGVGLAIVQRIVHRHGGRVWAEGQPDRGATFYFALPHRGDKP